MASWVDWLFVDRRTGRIVVGQKPNLLMLVFIAATASRVAAPSASRATGPVATALRSAQAGALLLWSLDEMVRGVNPFRRLGGAVVLAVAPFRRMLR